MDKGRSYGPGLESVLGRKGRLLQRTVFGRTAGESPRCSIGGAVPACVHACVPVVGPGVGVEIWQGGWLGGPRCLEGTVAPCRPGLGGEAGVEDESVGSGVLRAATLSSPADEAMAVCEKLDAAGEDAVSRLWLGVSFDYWACHWLRGQVERLVQKIDFAVGTLPPWIK